MQIAIDRQTNRQTDRETDTCVSKCNSVERKTSSCRGRLSKYKAGPGACGTPNCQGTILRHGLRQYKSYTLLPSQAFAMPACCIQHVSRCSPANIPASQGGTWPRLWHQAFVHDCYLMQCPCALRVARFLGSDLQPTAVSDLSLLAGWKQVPQQPPAHPLSAPPHPTGQSNLLRVSIPMCVWAAAGEPAASDGSELMGVLCHAETGMLRCCWCPEPLQVSPCFCAADYESDC